jgi:hypothetical protein
MAETKSTNNAKKVTVRLPRANGKDALQQEFFSVNDRRYLIKRGETVEIPPEVAEVIENGEKAEDYALNYIDDLKAQQREKDRENGFNN